jgi:hypothetical protein
MMLERQVVKILLSDNEDELSLALLNNIVGVHHSGSFLLGGRGGGGDGFR